MSSYRGSAWDGGPPGAEADYPGAPSYTPAAPPRAMPTTDPWTGVSYSQYGAPPYDYQAYAPGFTYAYDSTYYQRPDGTYYGKYPESGTYPQQLPAGYEHTVVKRERSRSPVDSRRYERRRSYQTNSRSVSPYDRKDSPYSKKRDSSYEQSHRRRSRSKSTKRKYSSSDRSTSRSHSYSPQKRGKRRKSVSSNSSASNRSYKKKSGKTCGRDQSAPPRERSLSGSREELNVHRMSSVDRQSKTSHEGEKKSKDAKSHSKKDKKARKITTPIRKQKKTKVSHKKSKKSLTALPKVHKKHKEITSSRSNTLVKKGRDSSLTPPKMYRMRMLSSSKSRSRSGSPSPSPRHSKRKRSLSRSPHPSRSRSSSRSGLSTPPRHSRSKSKRKSKRKSRSKSRTRRRSASKVRSTSQRRSKSRGKGKRSGSQSGSKSRSRSNSSRRSRSRSGSPTDEKRRGQFTVADRKRFWKMHRNRQEEKDKEKESKTPPKELKPPPGAVESTTVDDIEYGDPPEVEGPNFAELLMPDQAMQASTSKSRPGPLPIKNDGSFLEMFKKMQEVTKKPPEPEKKTEMKKPALPFIGKRRGGRVLKTGLVKKAKAIEEQPINNAPKDAWSLYMQEVKKYRETSCEEERKTRPLVK